MKKSKRKPRSLNEIVNRESVTMLDSDQQMKIRGGDPIKPPASKVLHRPRR